MNVLKFIAENNYLNIFDAIEKSYALGMAKTAHFLIENNYIKDGFYEDEILTILKEEIG